MQHKDAVQLRKGSKINKILKVSYQMIFHFGLKVVFRVQVAIRLKKVSVGRIRSQLKCSDEGVQQGILGECGRT